MPNGEFTNYTYAVPGADGGNTDPSGYETIFQQGHFDTPVHPQPPQNTFSGLMRHEIIIFKSCFNPNASITDDAMLEDYKRVYRIIRTRTDLYPSQDLHRLFNPAPSHLLDQFK